MNNNSMPTSICAQKAKRNEADRKQRPDNRAFGATDSTSSNRKRIRNRQRFDEAISPNAERVCNVRSTDVIFGRGKCYQEHPGNRRMRAIIRHYKEQYNTTPRSKKRDLAEALYSEITQDGARFLHKSAGEEDTFVVADIPIALQKVRNALRCKKSFGTTSAVSDDFDSPKPASTILNSGRSSLIGLNSIASDTYSSAHDKDRVAGRYGPLPTQLAAYSSSQLHVGVAPWLGPGHTFHEQQKLTMTHPVGVGGLVGNDLLSQRYHAGVATARWLQVQASPFESMRLLEGKFIGNHQPPWLGPSSPSLLEATYRDISLPVPAQKGMMIGFEGSTGKRMRRC